MKLQVSLYILTFHKIITYKQKYLCQFSKTEHKTIESETVLFCLENVVFLAMRILQRGRQPSMDRVMIGLTSTSF